MRLLEAGMQVNPLKSFWFQKEVEYLGYVITREGIKPQAKKVEKMMAMAAPKNKTELRGFVRMINYYRDLWPGRAHMLILFGNTHSLGTLRYLPSQWYNFPPPAFFAFWVIIFGCTGFSKLLNLFRTLFLNVSSKSFTCCCTWNEACPTSRLSNSSTIIFSYHSGLSFVKVSPLACLQVTLHVQVYQLPS